MKYVILIGDGMGDYAIESLGNKTPLASARTPNMDGLARRGSIGRARNIPDGMPVGSDVASMSIMGYDPHLYYSGRGPLEAASMGVRLENGQIAFRCNLITVLDGKINDFSAQHVSTTHSTLLMEMLDRELGGDGLNFYGGKSYRNLMVTGTEFEELECAPPHDHIGEPVEERMPSGSGQDGMWEIMLEANKLLQTHPVNLERRSVGEKPANWIWPWGQGKPPAVEPLTSRFGVRGSVVAAVDLILGVGVYAGLKPVTVPGGTGYLDTDYLAKARRAVELLKEDDLVVVHVEAPDEAAHGGWTDEKVKAIERFDEDVVGTVLRGLEKLGDYRVMVLPDHYTPISIRTHTTDPVPFAIYPSPDGMEPGDAFDEESAADRPAVPGHEVMEIFFNG